MKIYMAPMEGITGYTFRNIYRQTFTDADRYFTPFISFHQKFGSKVKNEIAPENNRDMDLVPQIMITTAQDALILEQMLAQLGYNHLNINIGCPSGTVVNKQRGAGMLRDPEKLDRILDGIYEKAQGQISIKTRIGWSDPDEWEDIVKVYAKYPMSELIVHTRVREEFYSGKPHEEAMDIVEKLIHCPVIYNGDIFNVSDAEHIVDKYPWLDGIMVGRGIFKNPGLIGELKGEPAATNAQIYEFVTNLYDAYLEKFASEINTLYHMKEIWGFLGERFPDCEKQLKTIRKTKNCAEYQAAVRSICL